MIKLLPILLLMLFLGLYNETDSKEAKPTIQKQEIKMLSVEKVQDIEKVAIEVKSEEVEIEIVEEENARPEIQGLPERLTNEILDYLWVKTKELNISYELMLSIAKIESDWNRDTYGKNRNGSHDSGLLQVNSSNVKWLSSMVGIKNPDPQYYKDNIDMGLALFDYERRYWLDHGYSEEDTYWLTVYAYHRGRGKTIKMAAKSNWKSSYVDRVTKIKEELESGIVE